MVSLYSIFSFFSFLFLFNFFMDKDEEVHKAWIIESNNIQQQSVWI